MLELIIKETSLIFNNEIKEYDNTKGYILLYNYDNVYFGELTYNTIINLPIDKYCIVIFGLTNKLIKLNDILSERLSILINKDYFRQSIFINKLNCELNIDYVNGEKIYIKYILPISKYFSKKVKTINELTSTLNSNLLNELNDNINIINKTKFSSNIISQIDDLIDTRSGKSSVIKSTTKYSIQNSSLLLKNINNITTQLQKYKNSNNKTNSFSQQDDLSVSNDLSISNDLSNLDKYINNLDTFTKKQIDNNKTIIEEVDKFVSTYNTNVSSIYTEQIDNIHQSIITDDINDITLENKRISAIQNIKDETTKHINKINEFKKQLYNQVNQQKQDDKNTKSAIKYFDIIKNTNTKLKKLKETIIIKNTELLFKLNEDIKNIKESVIHRKEEFKYNIKVKEIDIRDKIRTGLNNKLYKKSKSNSSVFIW